MNIDIAIIGGGAAGLVAASSAAENGKNVILFEKNNILGKKVLITGKGRCNITNNCDISTLIKNVKTNSKFMYSAFNTFSNQDIIHLLEKNDVQTKVERGNRVYPISDKSSDVVGALSQNALNKNVKIIHEIVTSIEKNNDTWIIRLGTNQFFAKKVIIATGGLSYPRTGSTGDGYKFASKLNHNIIPQTPSLVGIAIKEDFFTDMMGLSLKNIVLSLFKNGVKKPIFSEMGEMIFTHFGISGPLVLSMSAFIDEKNIDDYTAFIDWKPALDDDTLDKRLQGDFAKNYNREFKNSLSDLLPKKAIETFIKLSLIEPNKKTHQITKDERQALLSLLKKMPVTPLKLRPIAEAVVTSGGIDVKEINPSTMESKLHKGLYFAGEVMDVDGFTGGFNLQIAFSTGYLAGLKANESI